VEWERFEAFWLDFLNCHPLLPWPSDRTKLKRVSVAEEFGTRGHNQKGIDRRATMEDGSTLAIQLKDCDSLSRSKAVAAMDKAEAEYRADAYFLVGTGTVSPDAILEADRRGNWIVWSRRQFSSWILNPDHLPRHVAGKLIGEHFGEEWARELVPLAIDSLFLAPEELARRAKSAWNPHHHEIALVGEAIGKVVDELVAFANGDSGRVALLVAPGGVGKSRVLKEVADRMAALKVGRVVRFVNDDADPACEAMNLRQLDVANTLVILDDAHRSGSLRPRLLAELAKDEFSRIIVATRPPALGAVRVKLGEVGYDEKDMVVEQHLPMLGYEDRYALAVAILGAGFEEMARQLAEISKGCPLVCVVGAELVRSGNVSDDLLLEPEFREAVFDHLEESMLVSLFPCVRPALASKVLRALAVLAPFEPSQDVSAGADGTIRTGFKVLGEVFKVADHEIEELINEFRRGGCLARSAGGLRVEPDLLSDHLVYEVAYGEHRLGSLVAALVKGLGSSVLLNILANLSEAAWRARCGGEQQEGDYLAPIWEMFVERFEASDYSGRAELLKGWSKLAVFQPERTIEVARLALRYKRPPIAEQAGLENELGMRCDSPGYMIDQLPALLKPIATCHEKQRQDALNLLWEVGVEQRNDLDSDLSAAWKGIVETASYEYRGFGGPNGVFEWLQGRFHEEQFLEKVVERPSVFLSAVMGPWFEGQHQAIWSGGKTVHFQQVAQAPSSLSSFRAKVFDWLEAVIIQHSELACWNVLSIIARSLDLRPQFSSTALRADEENTREADAMRGSELARAAALLWVNPPLQVRLWQYLSEAARDEPSNDVRERFFAVRDLISRTEEFEVARLATSYDWQEWRNEFPLAVESGDGAEFEAWWDERHRAVVTRVVQSRTTIGEVMEFFQSINTELARFGLLRNWNEIAYVFVNSVGTDRTACLEFLMAHPEHPFSAEFGDVAVPREFGSGKEEKLGWLLRGLRHSDQRIVLSALWRITWRDVPLLPEIREQILRLSLAEDVWCAELLSRFAGWLCRRDSPYLESTLLSLDWSRIGPGPLQMLAHSIASRVGYGREKELPAEWLSGFWKTLVEREDIFSIISTKDLPILHNHFSDAMLEVYLERLDRWEERSIPWYRTDYSMKRLANSDGYELKARGIFERALSVSKEEFAGVHRVYEVAVLSVRPELAAEYLRASLDQIESERAVELLGSNRSTLIYKEPELLRIILERIGHLPSSERVALRRRMIWNATPQMRGWSNGDMDPEYRWAHENAVRLAEAYREDPVLFEFYREVAEQEKAEMDRMRDRYVQWELAT